MCFSFKIDDADADGFDVNTAVLWLFKSRTKRSRRNNSTRISPQTIVVSEVQQNTDPKYLPIVKTIAIQSVDVQGKSEMITYIYMYICIEHTYVHKIHALQKCYNSILLFLTLCDKNDHTSFIYLSSNDEAIVCCNLLQSPQ